MMEDKENREELLGIAAALYDAFEHEDVRLGIAVLAAALLIPDVDLPFMGDSNVVRVTDLAIKAVYAGE